ncbi:MAG TPA: hypothetical protein VGJ44_19380 [Kribbellaceae bacterium]|jgi:hypothetical protein
MNPARMPGRRHPLAIYLLGLCVTAGAGSLAGRTQPREIEAALPNWLSTAWAVVLVVGGGLALAGMLWRTAPAALVMECAGLCALAGVAAGYAAALAMAGRAAAAWTAFTVAAFSVACGCQAWQIVRPVIAARWRQRQEGRWRRR